MRVPYFQVNAFTKERFGGNPAGVCLLQQWLSDDVLQKIALENNLSETAFIAQRTNGWEIRWFTPEIEVDLCGHATLAAGFVLFEFLGFGGKLAQFQSRSGPLAVERDRDLFTLDFPRLPAQPCLLPDDLCAALGEWPAETYKGRDYLAVFEHEDAIRRLRPNMDLLRELDCLGVIATAPGTESDFVSRFFAPGAGVPEDPVTGSAHCALIPYWAVRLSKNRLRALQISRRGGELFCEDRASRVGIGGHLVLYLKGEIELSGRDSLGSD